MGNKAFDAGPCTVTVKQNGVVCFTQLMNKGQSAAFTTANVIPFRITVDVDSRIKLFCFTNWSRTQSNIDTYAAYALSVSITPSYPANAAQVVAPLFESGGFALIATVADALGTLAPVPVSSTTTGIAAGSLAITGTMPANRSF